MVATERSTFIPKSPTTNYITSPPLIRVLSVTWSPVYTYIYTVQYMHKTPSKFTLEDFNVIKLDARTRIRVKRIARSICASPGRRICISSVYECLLCLCKFSIIMPIFWIYTKFQRHLERERDTRFINVCIYIYSIYTYIVHMHILRHLVTKGSKRQLFGNKSSVCLWCESCT